MPCRNRQKAIVTFQTALQEVRAAAGHLQLAHPGLEDPPSFTAMDLKKSCLAATNALAAAQKVLAEPSHPLAKKGDSSLLSSPLLSSLLFSTTLSSFPSRSCDLLYSSRISVLRLPNHAKHFVKASLGH